MGLTHRCVSSMHASPLLSSSGPVLMHVCRATRRFERGFCQPQCEPQVPGGLGIRGPCMRCLVMDDPLGSGVSGFTAGGVGVLLFFVGLSNGSRVVRYPMWYLML